MKRITVDGVAAFPGYPAGVVAEGLLFLSGIRPIQNGVIPLGFDDLPHDARIGRQGFWLAEEQEEAVAVEAWAVNDALDRVLATVGSTQDHMLRTRIWQRDKRFYPSFERVRTIRQPNPSASSGHSVSGMPGRGGRVIGLDGVAIAVDHVDSAERTATGGTAQVARPLTYYSLAAQHGSFAFLAGHIPVKPEPGFPTVQSFDDVPAEGRRFATKRSHTDSRDGPIAAQTWYVYNCLRDSLQKIGAELGDIVHCLVGLQDLRDLPMFHRVHHDTFGDAGPALTIVGAGEVGHRGSRLVVEPTVCLSKTSRGRYEWPGRPPISAPMARRGEQLLFLSGIVGTNADLRFVDQATALPTAARTLMTQIIPWASRPEVAPQCWQAWNNLAAALESAGSSLDQLVKMTVFLADPKDWPVFEAVRAEFLGKFLPAIECVAVPNPGPSFRSVIQLDAIALGK